MQKRISFFIILFGFSTLVIGQNTVNNQSIDSLITKGDSLFKEQQFIPALNIYSEAILKNSEDNNQNTKLILSIKIADIYNNLNDFEKALEYYLNAHKIATALNDIDQLITINRKQGNLFLDMELREKGLQKINTAFDLFSKHKSSDSLLLTELLISQSNMYGSLGEYDLAYEGYQKIIPFLTKKKNTLQLATIYNNLGVDLKEQDRLQESIAHFNIAKKYWKANDNRYNLAVCDLNIALVLFRLNQLDSSSYYTQKALKEFQVLKRSYFIKNCYENLSKIEGIHGNHKQSLAYLKLHLKLKDSILNAQKIEKSIRKQTAYDLEIINEKNQLQLKINEEQSRSRIQFWSFLSLLLALGFIVVLMLFRRNKQKKELVEINLKNSELEQKVLAQEINLKNNKLSQLSTHILNKNQMLDELKEYIKEFKKEHDIDMRPFINKMSQQISMEQERKEFELFIDEKHTEFFFKVKQQHPNLTEKELKLCSLLLLGLSSKEIATLLKISPSSVDMSRYRLRKKLHIPSEKSIADFLSEI